MPEIFTISSFKRSQIKHTYFEVSIPNIKKLQKFWYIDRWSSPYSWGCTDDSCKPQEGEIVVIPAGQVILLDETTPLLKVRDNLYCSLRNHLNRAIFTIPHGSHMPTLFHDVTNSSY